MKVKVLLYLFAVRVFKVNKTKQALSALQTKAVVVMHPTCLSSPPVLLKRTAAVSSLELGLMAAFNYATLQQLLQLHNELGMYMEWGVRRSHTAQS